MFFDFLKKYIKDYIELSIYNFDITDEEIKDIADYISNDDSVWNYLENVIDQQLDRYRDYEEDENE